MKRIVALALCLLLCAPALGACSRVAQDDGLSIVCTVFPFYDWTREIVSDAEGVELTLLVGNGGDAHSYQPSAEDIVRIRRADLVIYAGGESDAWVEQALRQSGKQESQSLRLYDAEGVTLRHISQESVLSEEHDHDHGHDCEDDIDEHIWLSLDNAAACVRTITEAICTADAARETAYRENAEDYLARLQTLREGYAELAREADRLFLLFADRFPFVYLAEEYGMDYVAAFRGCTTDTDADPDTIIRLARAADENGVRAILVTESSDGALAEAVRRATAGKDQVIVALDSLQSVSESDRAAGVTYLSVMEKNLEMLRQTFLSA